MSEQLTRREQQILDFIKAFISEKSYSPSVREICVAVGLSSPSTVHVHLNKLVAKNKLSKNGSKSRTLNVIDETLNKNKNIINVPIVGKVAAGIPILAEQNIEDTFPIPSHLVGNSESFMLKVQGSSMIEAGIHDKDYVLIKKQQTCENGQIVVALVDEEATVKRFFKEKDHIRLQPENSAMSAIIVPDAKILGKVIGVFRMM